MTKSVKDNGMSVGIITYDYFHLKTEQVVHKLLRKREIAEIKIFALPFKKRGKKVVLIPHRPDQTNAITTEDLANKNGFEFIRWDGVSELVECNYYIITGAGILPTNVIKDKKIINAHPGIIPYVRGLDSFKWSIYEDSELGVTLHFIDEGIDTGEIITIEKTPIYDGDSLATLARRHYELEIDLISDYLFYINNPTILSFPHKDAPLHKRMPAEIEAKMVRQFDDYKEKHANPSRL